MLTFKEFKHIKKSPPPNQKIFSLNKGAQHNAFLCKSKYVILVGTRGSAKTTLILNHPLRNIFNPKFNAVYLRKQIKDSQGAGGIVDASKHIFDQFGVYKESIQLMYWKFDSGAKLAFLNYSSPIEEFTESIQGKEFSSVFIDEITQMKESHFNELNSSLRNTAGIYTQIVATCNPDPNSWVKDLVYRWLDPETEEHDPEKNGKEMFFFQYGDTIKDSVWGDTVQEVLEGAKDHIAQAMEGADRRYIKEEDYIQSISVFFSTFYENEHLMRNNGAQYIAALQKLSNEKKARYIRGSWKKVARGTGLINEADIENIINNTEQRTGMRYASMDLSGQGRDRTVLIIWDGLHIENVYTSQSKDAKQLFEWTVRILNAEEVPIDKKHFVYDRGGLGFTFTGYFAEDEAFQLVSNTTSSEGSKVMSPDDKKIKVYKNLKSEVVGKFVSTVKNYNGVGECGVSISKNIARTEFQGRTFRSHLESECACLMWKDDDSGVKEIIPSKEIKSIVGRSPDFMMAVVYRFALDVGKKDFVPFEEEDIEGLSGFFI